MNTTLPPLASPIRRAHIFALSAICIVLAYAPPAHAWNYAEHWSISYVSYANACSDLEQEYQGNPEKSAQLRKFCAEPVKLCAAHLAGVAGDYVEDDKTLREDSMSKQRHYLFTEVDDCSSIERIIRQGVPRQQADDNPLTKQLANVEDKGKLATRAKDASAEELPCAAEPWIYYDAKSDREKLKFEWLGQPLVRGKFFAWHHWATLALNNYQHFQPDSGLLWYSDWDKLTLDVPPEQGALDDAFRRHGFAMHFLEDAFPAGHIGITRARIKEDKIRLGLRQDYAHAYHDDMNDAGEFQQAYEQSERDKSSFSTADARTPAFSFGDGHLCQPTVYVNVKALAEKNNVGIDQMEQLIDRLVEVLNSEEAVHEGQKVTDDKDFRDDLAGALKALLNGTSDNYFTLSLKGAPRSWLATQGCGVLNVCTKSVYVLTDRPPANNGLCRARARDAIVFRCHETSAAVIGAATFAQRAFLRRLLGDDGVEREIAMAQERVPKLFSGISTAVRRSDSKVRLNRDDLLVRYPRELAPIRPESPSHEMVAFGFDYSKRTVTDTGSDQDGQNLNAVMQFAAFAGVGEPEIRLSIAERYNDRWRAFAGVEANYAFALPAKLGNPSGLAFDAGFGVDRIWDGPSRRNGYVFAGPSFELRAGRFVVFTEALATYVLVSGQGWRTGYAVNLGVRVPSLALVSQRPPPR